MPTKHQHALLDISLNLEATNFGLDLDCFVFALFDFLSFRSLHAKHFAQDGSYVDGVGKIFVAFSDRVKLMWDVFRSVGFILGVCSLSI